MASRLTHAGHPLQSEFTLCGIAFDVSTIEAEVADPVFASRGQAVTCGQCRYVVTEIKKIKLDAKKGSPDGR